MSNRVAGTSDEALAAWIKDVERRLDNLSTGGLRGPNSSFGLPFQVGNYRFFDHNGELCVLNLDTNEIQCMTGGDGGCLLRVNRYFTPGSFTLDIPGGTQVIEFYVLGAGGGGGGGARPDTGQRASGGGGGGNGCCEHTKLTIEQFTVMLGGFVPNAIVGAGGEGGDPGFAAGAAGIEGDNGGTSAIQMSGGEGINGIIGGGGGKGGGGAINTDADGGVACGFYGPQDGGGNMDLPFAATVTGGNSYATFDDNIGGGGGRRGFCSGGGGGGGGTTSGDVATTGDPAEGNNGISRFSMVGNGYGGNGGIAGGAIPVIGGRGCGGGGGAAGTAAELFGQKGAAGGDGEVVVIFYGGCGPGGAPGALGDAGGNVGGGGSGDGEGGPGGEGGGGGGGTGGGGTGGGGTGGPAGDGLVRVGIDWTQDRPPVAGYDTLQQTFKIHNHHIACFGMTNAATFISPGVYDWTDLDACIASMESAAGPGAQLMITFCEAPPWATDGGLECDGVTVEFPNAANYANFAQLCADVADRYPQVLYFQFWNEFKGLFDGGLGRWRYEDYTDLYNLVEAAVHGVRPDALLGGPYPVFSSGDGSMSNPSALTFAGGSVDQRDLDVMTYFAANANDGGGDFIAIDLFAGNIRGGPVIATGQTNTSMMEDKFIKSLQWVRANIDADKLIVVSETYVNAGGYTQDQAGTALINMMVRVEAEVTVGNGIWFMLWHEQDEFPQVYFFGDGSEYAFANQLRAWQP